MRGRSSSASAGRAPRPFRTRLTAFKVPHEIRIVTELPRNSSGKLDKRALLAEVGADT